MVGWALRPNRARQSIFHTYYNDLQIRDMGADWYLHPNKRLLLCGSAKAPPQTPSRLSLVELVAVLEKQR